MTTEQMQEAAGVDRAAIRAELEQTRRAYRDLLGSLTAAEWRRKSGNPAWTVGQLMWHLASNVAFSAEGAKRSRQGKGFNIPSVIADPLNTLMTRFGARKATKASVAQQYDAGHEKLLAALDATTEADWKKGAKFFGRFVTVEGQFRSVKEHFDEHNADIQKVLRR